MKGYIKFSDHECNREVAFGFAVPIPADGKELVTFDVEEIRFWAQRGEAPAQSLIGETRSGWISARPGESFQQLGIYLGRNLVLLAKTV